MSAEPKKTFENDLLSEHEACNLLNVNRFTLYRLRRARRLDYVKIGVLVRYPRESLAWFIEANMHFARPLRRAWRAGGTITSRSTSDPLIIEEVD